MKLKTKKGKTRFLRGFLLSMVFVLPMIFALGGGVLMFGLGFLNQAEAISINKEEFQNFTYKVESLDVFRRINLGSYLNKPVKIPLENGNEQDLLIVYPPKVLNKTTSLPLRTTLFSAGSSPNKANLEFARNIESQINAIAENNQTLLEILRNLAQSNLKVSMANEDELLRLLIQKVQAEENLDADTFNLNPLLLEDADTSTTGEALSGSSSQTRQLLVILLLLLYMNQSLASSLNQEKEQCLESGGEWTNGECFNENELKCEDGGGTWKLFKNVCYLESQICGSKRTDCSNFNANSNDYSWEDWSEWNINSNSNDNNDPRVYGCACNSSKCLNEENLTCIPKENTKKDLCEKSGGDWREFDSAEELCLMRCGKTEETCENATFNDNDNWLSGGENEEAQENCDCGDKCLSVSGKCIKKETTKEDDDKDGVINQYDKCANTPQGEAVNNIENHADRGCSCNQLNTMGKIPKVYCPPDGCEGNNLIRYDRSAMNQVQCQNGVIQQQNNYGNTGSFDPYSSTGYSNSSSYGSGTSYGNNTCPVISRMPDNRCNNNNNQNDNTNKALEDLLKKLLDNKNKNQNNNSGGKNDSGGGGGGGGGGPSDSGDDKTKPDPNANTNGVKKTPSGNDPEGVGQFNKDRNGTDKDPYLLHATQFTKLCAENTYVLTNAKPKVGKLRDKPETKSGDDKKPASSAPTKPDTTCGTNGCPKAGDDLKNRIEISKIVQSEDWSKVSQSARDKIDAITSKLKGTGATANQAMLDMIKKMVEEGKKELAQNATASPTQNQDTNEYDSMQDIKGATPLYKMPTCQELASAHCCVCSACNQADCGGTKGSGTDPTCGWAVGQNCATSGKGECKGEKCTACSNTTVPCKEDAGKSIKLAFDKADPMKGWNIGNNKGATSQKKCEDYKEKTHQGVCRYDCEGEAKGCEEGYEDCKIIIISNGDKVEHSDLQSPTPTSFNSGIPSGGMTSFVNRKEGSIVRVNSDNLTKAAPTVGSKDGWVQELDNNPGKPCNCQKSPTGNKPQM